MHNRGMDYFENSARSTIGQRAYAIANPLHFRGYGEDVWGLTACNGPGEITWEHEGTQTLFAGYSARGADADRVFDDGTLAPTAAISSIVFTPEISLRAMQEMYRRYGPWLYSDYGFKDAFNPSFQLNAPLRTGSVVPGQGWFDNEYLGIDQGPILLMVENYRSGFVWKVMRSNPYIRKGLQRAGFKGGWLSGANDQAANARRARAGGKMLARAQ
jgi:hypothetical protein